MAEQVTSAKATAKTVRIPARKARLVIDLIRGKSVAEALGILKFTPRSGAFLVEKVLKSAIANAENNNGLSAANLKIKSAIVNQGVAFRRFRPVARGSAHPIRKRTSHISIVLSDEK